MHRAFQDAVARAGLDPVLVTPHVMRHTAITKLVQAGLDLPTIQKISGHRTVKMVLKYVHVHDRHIDQAMRALAAGMPMSARKSDTIRQDLQTPIQPIYNN